MNTAVAAMARVSFFLCAGLIGSTLAQGDQASSDPQCVKSRCFTPSCYHQYAGGYYLRCPDGVHPIPQPEQTAPTEGDRPGGETKSSAPVGAEVLQAVGGDWEFRLGASPKPMAVLRLRPSSTGSLEGTLEQSLGAQTSRVGLQDVAVSGTTVSFATPGGKIFRGTLSADHQTIVGEAGSPSWTRVRPLAQAQAEDAKSH